MPRIKPGKLQREAKKQRKNFNKTVDSGEVTFNEGRPLTPRFWDICIMSREDIPKKITRSVAVKLALTKGKEEFQPSHRSTELFGGPEVFSRSPKLARTPPQSPIPRQDSDNVFTFEPQATGSNQLDNKTVTGQGQDDQADNKSPPQEASEGERHETKTHPQERQGSSIMADTTLATSLNNQRTPTTPKFLCPTTFNPAAKNASTFLNNYDRTAAANGWDDMLKISYLHTFLEGAAYLWFERYKDNEANGQKTWAQIKADFQKEFEGEDSKRVLERKLYNRKQDQKESITSYYYDLQTLFGEYDPSFDVDQFRNYFENGIHPDHYQHYRLLMDEDTSWDKFKGIIRKLEDISAQKKTSEAVAVPTNTIQNHNCSCSHSNNNNMNNLPNRGGNNWAPRYQTGSNFNSRSQYTPLNQYRPPNTVQYRNSQSQDNNRSYNTRYYQNRGPPRRNQYTSSSANQR
ncbi:hypothetical protein NQ315_014574 [Exocentrus adspersus]|uniref:Retrotransposon gag domain-containing protein n=1 Tax=Exocentrus adspersus TaxID=1586481 RepID=A0AAV8VE53_9CUCU|nr:hypothetical protein NQ315_014574 [Exocentrus adspersus]